MTVIIVSAMKELCKEGPQYRLGLISVPSTTEGNIDYYLIFFVMNIDF